MKKIVEINGKQYKRIDEISKEKVDVKKVAANMRKDKTKIKYLITNYDLEL